MEQILSNISQIFSFDGQSMSKYTWSKKSKKFTPLTPIKGPLKTLSTTTTHNCYGTNIVKY